MSSSLSRSVTPIPIPRPISVLDPWHESCVGIHAAVLDRVSLDPLCPRLGAGVFGGGFEDVVGLRSVRGPDARVRPMAPNTAPVADVSPNGPERTRRSRPWAA